MPAASGLSCALFLIRLTTMPERACTLLIRLTLLLLLGLLGACASSGVVTRDSVPQGESAEQLVEAGKLEEAAAEFLRLAETGSRADSAHYSLRAGETLRENGDYAGAQRAIARDSGRARRSGEVIVLKTPRHSIAADPGGGAANHGAGGAAPGGVALVSCSNAVSSLPPAGSTAA